MRKGARWLLFALLVSAVSWRKAHAATLPFPLPLHVPATLQTIVIDGDLSDPGWKDAAIVQTFYEIRPGDNIAPKVETTASITYDSHYFYVAFDCHDPHPESIRATYMDRDKISVGDDYVAIWIDTHNDHRYAMDFYTNPRGVQTDGIFYDATYTQNFSPDFFYDSAARITSSGWTAEFRIPFSTLRYPKNDVQKWAVILYRNYPRDHRYVMLNTTVPRGSNCLVCRAAEMGGMTGLPSSGKLIVAPYGTASESAAPRGEPGTDMVNEPVEFDGGLDAKWTPNPSTALDGTVNPDFSQVESDVGQIQVNNRFALFFPEKRPFFLESVDLFDTTIQAVHSRTITSPRWGTRATGQWGSAGYTFLLTQDRGGGSVLIPGPTSSTFASQDFSSVVAIGRVRQNFGNATAGVLFTDREIEGGGHNRVFGPDLETKLGQFDLVTSQLLLSESRTPDRPDLADEWDGRKLSSAALHLEWQHSDERWYADTSYSDYGNDFRADVGFVPQVGFRTGYFQFGRNFYPTTFITHIRPVITLNYSSDRDNRLIGRTTALGYVISHGMKSLYSEMSCNVHEKVRIDNRLLSYSYVYFYAEFAPWPRFYPIGISVTAGQNLDVVNARVGNGASINGFATIVATDHLQLDLNAVREWLNVTPETAPAGRLFTAQITRLKVTYNFTARIFFRLIGQYSTVNYTPELYSVPVPERSADFSGSALFSYKLNWQTVFFVGYGDNRTLSESDELVPVDRQFFVKFSYAL